MNAAVPQPSRLILACNEQMNLVTFSCDESATFPSNRRRNRRMLPACEAGPSALDEARPAAIADDGRRLLFRASPNPRLRAEDYRRGPPGALQDREHRRVSALGHATAWSMLRSVVAGRRRASVSHMTLYPETGRWEF